MPLGCYKSPGGRLPRGGPPAAGWLAAIMLQSTVCCNCLMPECGLGVLSPMFMMCSYMLGKLGPRGTVSCVWETARPPRGPGNYGPPGDRLLSLGDGPNTPEADDCKARKAVMPQVAGVLLQVPGGRCPQSTFRDSRVTDPSPQSRCDAPL